MGWAEARNGNSRVGPASRSDLNRTRMWPQFVVRIALSASIASTLIRAWVMPDANAGVVAISWAFGFGGLFVFRRGISSRSDKPADHRLAMVALVVCIALCAVAIEVTSGPVLAVWFGASAAAVSIYVLGLSSDRRSHVVSSEFAVAAAMVSALAVVAATRTSAGREVIVPAVVLAAIFGVELFKPSALSRVMVAVRRWVGTSSAGLLFGALGIVLLSASWLFAAGFDVVSRRNAFGRAVARWCTRPNLPMDARRRSARRHRPWERLDQTRGDSPWSVAPWSVVVVSAVAALALGAAFGTFRRTDAPQNRGLSLADVAQRSEGRGGSWWDEPDDVPAAYAGDEWYPEYKQDSEWVMNQGVAFQPLHANRVKDVATRYVNVVDGDRRTWRPPACNCRRISVWLYGGSTTFGIGQRDDFTIPSMLAKIAWKNGVALDVVNRGVPGDMHWQEADRLAWDLSRAVSPPDVIIFYDGVNEIWGTGTVRDSANPDPIQPIAPLTDQFWNEVLRVYDSQPPPAPPGGRVLAASDGTGHLTAEQVGRLSVERYERSLSMSRDIATAREIPALWFWQPSRLSRPPVAGEPTDGDGEDEARAITAAAESVIPNGVIDISGVFDGNDSPMFSDDVHHNELGADIVAAAIYEHLAPLLGGTD